VGHAAVDLITCVDSTTSYITQVPQTLTRPPFTDIRMLRVEPLNAQLAGQTRQVERGCCPLQTCHSASTTRRTNHAACNATAHFSSVLRTVQTWGPPCSSSAFNRCSAASVIDCYAHVGDFPLHASHAEDTGCAVGCLRTTRPLQTQ
jgi:hypothetical protein